MDKVQRLGAFDAQRDKEIIRQKFCYIKIVSEARINHGNCNTVADGGRTSLNNPSLGCKRCDVPWS